MQKLSVIKILFKIYLELILWTNNKINNENSLQNISYSRISHVEQKNIHSNE